MTLIYKLFGKPGNIDEAIEQTKEKKLESARFYLEGEESTQGIFSWQKGIFLDCYLDLNPFVRELSRVNLGHYSFHKINKSGSEEEAEKIREEGKRFIISLAEQVLEMGNRMNALGITDIMINHKKLEDYKILLEKGNTKKLVDPTLRTYLKAFEMFPFP